MLKLIGQAVVLAAVFYLLILLLLLFGIYRQPFANAGLHEEQSYSQRAKYNIPAGPPGRTAVIQTQL